MLASELWASCVSPHFVVSAVNLFKKKNWIGSFATPWAVINDATLLETLSDRDFVCGFSEAVKVSLLKDLLPYQYVLVFSAPSRSGDRGVSRAVP